ncbi:MAG: glucose-1-phosphate adenylyltransferase [Planctomycetaceae bacterium]|jgi:glucose-1-phosphate adenylyltransferase|nr:glucose-1-phosphate adenylyltransferase [Planctomycetaceae bacterium]
MTSEKQETMKERVLAVILAGGKGSRLDPLTRDRAKPAVPFGGAYRIIDFALSNCLNSGFRQMLLFTQYKAMSLDRHIARGWTRYFCRERGEFVDVVPPQQRIDESWYQGTADAVYQNIFTIEKEEPDYVVILAGDHIYKMNYRSMLEDHIANQAHLTIGVLPVAVDTARGQFGVMETDENHRVVGFEEKPASPRTVPGDPSTCLASMGIYIFSARFLYEELCRDATRRHSRHDFGCDIIPSIIDTNRVFAYRFMDENRKAHAYWRDVGTLDAYYDANMDLVTVDPLLNLYDEEWPISTYHPNFPPPKFVFAEENRSGHATDSIVCSGTILSGGSVSGSVIGHHVRVNSYASIEDSIIFSHVNVGRNAHIRRAIIDKGVLIPSGMEIGFDPELDRSRGFTVTENGVTVIAKGETFPA